MNELLRCTNWNHQAEHLSVIHTQDKKTGKRKDWKETALLHQGADFLTRVTSLQTICIPWSFILLLNVPVQQTIFNRKLDLTFGIIVPSVQLMGNEKRIFTNNAYAEVE